MLLGLSLCTFLSAHGTYRTLYMYINKMVNSNGKVNFNAFNKYRKRFKHTTVEPPLTTTSQSPTYQTDA